VLESGATGRRHTRRPLQTGGSTFDGIRIIMDESYPHAMGPGRSLFESSEDAHGADIHVTIGKVKPEHNPTWIVNMGVRDGDARVVIETVNGTREDLLRVRMVNGTLRPEIRSPVAAGGAMVRLLPGSQNVRVQDALLEQPAAAPAADRIGLDLRSSSKAVVAGCRSIRGVQTPVAMGSDTVMEAPCAG
jgi:hypothetical protein